MATRITCLIMHASYLHILWLQWNKICFMFQVHMKIMYVLVLVTVWQGMQMLWEHISVLHEIAPIISKQICLFIKISILICIVVLSLTPGRWLQWVDRIILKLNILGGVCSVWLRYMDYLTLDVVWCFTKFFAMTYWYPRFQLVTVPSLTWLRSKILYLMSWNCPDGDETLETTRYVDGTPTFEVTPVTIWYIHPP